ncbi:MAG: hypothetical protein ACREBC_30960, partial [Pyrinomonadaceae bacterium]
MGTVQVFRHFIRFELFMLMLVEFLIFVASLYGGALVRYSGEFDSAEQSIGWLLPRALVFAAVMEFGLAAMGMYDPSQREGLRGTILRIVAGIVLGAVAMVVGVYVFPTLYLGRG